MLKIKIYQGLADEAQYRCKVSKKHSKRKPRMHGKVRTIIGEQAQAFTFEQTPSSIVINKQCGDVLKHDSKAGIQGQVFNQKRKGKQ